MKNIIALLSFLILLGCGSDDSVDPTGGDPTGGGDIELSFSVSVIAVGIHGAQIAWSPPTGGNSGNTWVYRVVLDNEVIADGLDANSFSFSELDDLTAYSGTVFAIGSNGLETFGNFSFTTLENTICPNGVIVLRTQADVDNFIYTECDRVVIRDNNITDLSPLIVLRKVGSLEIFYSALANLNGLEHIRKRNGNLGISIIGNSQLVDVSALTDLFYEASNISFIQNPNLTNLAGLQVSNELDELQIQSCGVTEIPSFGDMPLRNILLQYLPLSDFSAFRFTPEINKLEVLGLPNITGFAGFDNIEKLYHLDLRSNQNLTNLADLETLTGSPGVGDWAGKVSVYIRDNPNLTNFCGIQQWMVNTEVKIGCLNPPSCTQTEEQFSVYNNAYNPTEVQIESPTDCSL